MIKQTEMSSQFDEEINYVYLQFLATGTRFVN